MTDSSPSPQWSEEASRAFLSYAPYFVPQRQKQIDLLCSLIPSIARPLRVLELGCGEGLLAETVLQRLPHSQVLALDGSAAMRARARERLAPFGERAHVAAFDLAQDDWRRTERPFHAVVSSLAIHHLDGRQKRTLFRNLFEMLAPGGALVIADVILPAGFLSIQAAAQEFDRVVYRQAVEVDGQPQAYDRFQKEGWNLYRYPDPIDKPSTLFDQLVWLQQAGFGLVDVYWMQAGHAVFGGRKLGPVWPVPVEQVRPLRLSVLRPGQPAQAAEYPGDDDPENLHLAAVHAGQIVGVCSVYREAQPGEENPDAWRLRGVAVQAEAQRFGYGRALILACLDYVAEKGGSRLWCNARETALPFYEALGFEIVSDRFEVPISGPHYRMARPVLDPVNPLAPGE